MRAPALQGMQMEKETLFKYACTHTYAQNTLKSISLSRGEGEVIVFKEGGAGETSEALMWSDVRRAEARPAYYRRLQKDRKRKQESRREVGC